MNRFENNTLFYRQKVFLALLQAFGQSLPRTDLQKYLFLFTEIYQKEKSYEFVPYKYGCYSFQSYADFRNLSRMGLVEDVGDWRIINEQDYIEMLNVKDRENILLFQKEFGKLKGNKLIRCVYRDYPYYAINSELVPKLSMSTEELNNIKRARPAQRDLAFFTIGYEGNSFENYLNRLIKNNIKVLCDVRRNPISRKYGFSKKTLSETLEKLGIKYVSFPELGIISEKRKNLKTKNEYDNLFHEYEKTTLKRNGDAINQLAELLKEHRRISITCFEKDHTMCHRHRIAQTFSQTYNWTHKVQHI